MTADIVAIILGAMKFLSLFLTEYFEQKKIARIANEKYEITKQKFLDISQKAIDKMRSEAASDSKQAQDIEDEIDKRIK